jgi:acyl carrier protein phosphodiesterase
MIRCLQKYKDIMPGSPAYFLEYIIKNNRILDYHKTETIQIVLEAMAKRTKFNSGIEKAITHLIEYEKTFEKDFLTFFPQLQEYTGNYLSFFPNNEK